jgi:hypothetical protein
MWLLFIGKKSVAAGCKLDCTLSKEASTGKHMLLEET